MVGGLSRPEVRYLLWSLPVRAETETVRRSVTALLVALLGQPERTHLSLDKDAPVPRAAQPPTCGTIVQVPHLGGLHHHGERRAA